MSLKEEFLFELASHPIWQAIVKEITEGVNLPKYNPSDPKRDSQTQEDRWKYESGRQSENDRICQILNIRS